MDVFTEHKTEWIIGISCTFLPAIIGEIIKRTSSIPNITIPFWLFCLLVALIPTYFAVKSYSARTKDIANKSFGVERVVVDGKHFTNCKFNGTELVFTGARGFSMSHSSGTGARFRFEGPAANTIYELGLLYKDVGTRFYAENVIAGIKNDKPEQKTQ
jgi:hypothetical protein